MQKTLIVSITTQAPMIKLWKAWTQSDHIIHWAYASPEWYCPQATNDLEVGGHFSTAMAAKDGSASFDFSGVYTKIIPYKLIEYLLDDGRKVQIGFDTVEGITTIQQIFESEPTHSIEQQKSGWQAILENFKHYVEML